MTTPTESKTDPFADWEPGHNWLAPAVPQPCDEPPDDIPHYPSDEPPEDHSDDICPCGDADCSRPFGHAEQSHA